MILINEAVQVCSRTWPSSVHAEGRWSWGQLWHNTPRPCNATHPVVTPCTANTMLLLRFEFRWEIPWSTCGEDDKNVLLAGIQ